MQARVQSKVEKFILNSYLIKGFYNVRKSILSHQNGDIDEFKVALQVTILTLKLVDSNPGIVRIFATGVRIFLQWKILTYLPFR